MNKLTVLIASMLLAALFNMPTQAAASGSLQIGRHGYTQVTVNGNPYYYDDQGVYYTGGPGHYVVVEAPEGAVVYRPVHYEQVNMDGVVYYKYNNAYYQRSGRGYKVVRVQQHTEQHNDHDDHGHDNGHDRR